MLHMSCSDAALSELEHGGGHTPTDAGSHSQVLDEVFCIYSGAAGRAPLSSLYKGRQDRSK